MEEPYDSDEGDKTTLITRRIELRFADRIKVLAPIGRHVDVSASRERTIHSVDEQSPFAKVMQQISGRGITPRHEGAGDRGGNLLSPDGKKPGPNIPLSQRDPFEPRTTCPGGRASDTYAQWTVCFGDAWTRTKEGSKTCNAIKPHRAAGCRSALRPNPGTLLPLAVQYREAVRRSSCPSARGRGR